MGIAGMPRWSVGSWVVPGSRVGDATLGPSHTRGGGVEGVVSSSRAPPFSPPPPTLNPSLESDVASCASSDLLSPPASCMVHPPTAGALACAAGAGCTANLPVPAQLPLETMDRAFSGAAVGGSWEEDDGGGRRPLSLLLPAAPVGWDTPSPGGLP